MQKDSCVGIIVGAAPADAQCCVARSLLLDSSAEITEPIVDPNLHLNDNPTPMDRIASMSSLLDSSAEILLFSA